MCRQRIVWNASRRLPWVIASWIDSLDKRFKGSVGTGCVQPVAHRIRWAEGRTQFRAGHYLLFSDIPNNRMCVSSDDGRRAHSLHFWDAAFARLRCGTSAPAGEIRSAQLLRALCFTHY
jgi:hypothetical protein